ncbi:MAG: hypothetical protein HY289_13345 [Planctomycetes bacterium]|nr:hypothetical protein [Planctomycetota bacterium]
MEPSFLPNFFERVVCGSAVILFATVLYRLQVIERRILAAFEMLYVTFTLPDRGLLSVYRRMARAIMDIGAQSDPLASELASLRLTTIAEEMEQLGKGSVVFSGTETWRAAYQKLLPTLKVKSYLSVAWVRTSDYWDDTPGRQSMQLNFDLADRGFRIERVHILPAHLWPLDDRLPVPAILAWLQEQHVRNILVSVVREQDLAKEPDLLCDFAIYGDRATGKQELDEQSRTQRFVLSFAQESHRQAMARWERLGLYTISLADLTD